MHCVAFLSFGSLSSTSIDSVQTPKSITVKGNCAIVQTSLSTVSASAALPTRNFTRFSRWRPSSKCSPIQRPICSRIMFFVVCSQSPTDLKNDGSQYLTMSIFLRGKRLYDLFSSFLALSTSCVPMPRLLKFVLI